MKRLPRLRQVLAVLGVSVLTMAFGAWLMEPGAVRR